MTFSLDFASASSMGLVVLVAKATLLLLAALGASVLLQRASAGARHLVWVAMVVALLLLPALSAWSPVRLAILPPAVATSPTAPVTAIEPAPPVPVDPRRIPAEAARAEGVPPAPSSHESPARWSRWEIALLVWGTAAAGLGLWVLWGFLSVGRIVRRARVLDGRDWTGPLYEIADRLGIDQAPRLVQSDRVKMPFACGLVTATIVLPDESDGWSAERRRAVLMHELAHIKRRDLVGHTLGRVACAVYWFHPLVWTAARRLRVESEKACDDLALTCGLKASTYAEHLLDIVSNIRQPHTPAAAIPMAHRREFEGRMLAILDPGLRRRAGRWQSLSLVGGLAALVVVVGGAAPAQRGQPAVATPEVAAQPTRGVDEGLQHEVSRSLTKHTDRSEQTRRDEVKVTRVEALGAGDAPSVARAGGITGDEVLQQLAQGKPADERAVLLMQVLRSDSSTSLRRVAAWGLAQYADREDVGTALATALRRDSSDRVREMAAWSLASGEDRKTIIDALADALRRDANAEVREMAAWALGNLGAEGGVDALSAVLNDASVALRGTALWALGNSGADKAPQAAIDALGDKDARVRKLAAWVLYQVEDASAVPALEAALNRETEKELRTAYIRALGAIGGESAGALSRLLDSRDPDVRAVVVNALAGRGGAPWPWPQPRPRPNP